MSMTKKLHKQAQLLQDALFPKLEDTSSESSSDDGGVMQGQMLLNNRKICKIIRDNNNIILRKQTAKFDANKKRKETAKNTIKSMYL